MSLVQLSGVTRDFGPETRVLRGIDLTIAPGESAAIVGPSGSGKSTLLNIIGTLDRPTTGRVLLEGRDVATLDEAQQAALRAGLIGFVFQQHHLLPACTLLENVLVPSLVTNDDGAEERARKLLDRVGLTHRLDHRPGTLSGGECQRAAVARALINRPKLLLADEPTGALDRANAEAVLGLLWKLNKEEGVALVLVTHAPEQAAKAARTLELRDGLLVS